MFTFEKMPPALDPHPQDGASSIRAGEAEPGDEARSFCSAAASTSSSAAGMCPCVKISSGSGHHLAADLMTPGVRVAETST